jgi:hypothetical protein
MGEILMTTAAAWGVFLVAGAGVAVLPWTDREARAVTTALAAIPSTVRRLARAHRRARQTGRNARHPSRVAWRGAFAGELSSLS